MNLEELEETLDSVLPGAFSIETNRKGEIVIYTGLRQDDDGELVDFETEEDDDEELENDEEFEPLDEDDEDE